MIVWTMAGLLLASVSSSCSAGGNPEAYSVQDSAGVRISMSTAPAWTEGQGWTVLDTPILDLGGVGAPPAFQFEQLLNVAILPNESIVATDMNANQVLFFSREGEFVARKGRRGSGPGEFQSLFGLAVLGDSVMVYDRYSARVTVFGWDGEFLGVRTFDDPPEGTPPLRHYYLAGSFAGKLLFVPRVFLPSGGGNGSIFRNTAPNLLYDMTKGFEGEIAEPAGVDMFSGAQGASAVPFSTLSSVATGTGELFICHGRDFEIRRFDGSGRLTAVIRRSHDPRPVTEEDLGEEIAAHLRRAGASSANDPHFEGFRRMMESAPLPESMPAVDGLLVGAKGSIWAHHFVPGYETGPDDWSVISDEGRWLGVVSMPERFRTQVVGVDYILGVYTDTLDIEHIRMLPLRREP